METDLDFNHITITFFPEAATRGLLYKKLLLKISQKSQENTYARASFLIKSKSKTCNFKRDSGTGVLL